MLKYQVKNYMVGNGKLHSKDHQWLHSDLSHGLHSDGINVLVDARQLAHFPGNENLDRHVLDKL